MTFARPVIARLPEPPRRTWVTERNHTAGFDLLALVGEDCGPGRHSAGTHMFRCPSPQHDDRTPSFAVRHTGERWVYHCHGCGAGGDAADYHVLTGRAGTQADALQLIRAGADGAPPAPAPRQRPAQAPQAPQAPAGPLPAPRHPPDADKLLRAFLVARGWTGWAADTYQLTVIATPTGQAVRFPWSDSSGRTVWAQDRALDPSADKADRWKSTAGRPCPTPYGWEQTRLLDQLRANPTEHDRGLDLIICEGVTDTVALMDAMHQHPQTSMTTAVGLPGGNLKREWVPLFAGLDLVVITDNDRPGAAKRTKIATQLAGTANTITHLHPPSGHNDLAEWRHATGDRFRPQFVDALADALDTTGPL